MKIFLQEIKETDSELDFTQDEKWVVDAVSRVDEMLEGDRAAPGLTKNRPIRAHFSLRLVDDVFVINGKIQTQLQLVCSRCANYCRYEAKPEFSALFCKDPVMAGVGHLSKDAQTPAGKNRGFARHAHDSESDSDRDIDITYISDEYVDLAELLTEQLQLQVPFQPLCSEDCKGMCHQCGADLNKGRCACAKMIKETPFSVLKDFKVRH